MPDIHPDALSLEDAQPIIESQPIQQEPVVEDPEPEGVVEHQGRRMVDVSVLAAERRRVRDATERAIREREIAPLQQKAQDADRLRDALAQAQPYLDHLRQHPELLQPPKPTQLEEQIGDDEAAAEARDLELYDSRTGQPDLGRAKRIIARRRQETQTAAHQAAQAAVGPITSQTAQSASRDNFVTMATQRDVNNQPLVDPKTLAEMWASLPPELTAHREVGELVLNAAIGKSLRAGRRVARPERDPLVSEAAGGRVGQSYQMDHMAKQIAKHAGISDKQFQESGKGYQPGMTNVLGD